ncbi:MAG: TRAP transporter small permease subunit [Rubrivivax sp.]|nr:MAG: TRAP transporter small permease subunit [Rubrivivax sp.]
MGRGGHLFVRGVDALSMRLGQLAAWLLVLACAISAGNALIRYTFNLGSNAWLEAQWYLFGAAVFLGAPALLKLNEHVRVDVVYGSRAPRTQAWIDLLGLVFVLLPVCVITGWLSIHMVQDAYVQQEVSPSAGGLLRWPIKAMIPLGFALLGLQTLSEIVKRIAYLRGGYNMDTHYERPLQ